MTIRRKPQQRERGEQAEIVKLLRSLGAHVYVLGTTRRRGDYAGTMQTPGLPDLLAFLPRPTARVTSGATVRELLVVEVKAAGGRLRPEQTVFRDTCAIAGVAHVTGGIDAVIAWLIAQGYLKASQVAHYRQPTAAAGDIPHRPTEDEWRDLGRPVEPGDPL